MCVGWAVFAFLAGSPCLYPFSTALLTLKKELNRILLIVRQNAFWQCITQSLSAWYFVPKQSWKSADGCSFYTLFPHLLLLKKIKYKKRQPEPCSGCSNEPHFWELRAKTGNQSWFSYVMTKLTPSLDAILRIMEQAEYFRSRKYSGVHCAFRSLISPFSDSLILLSPLAILCRKNN